jgi:hypothetical protein
MNINFIKTIIIIGLILYIFLFDNSNKANFEKCIKENKIKDDIIFNSICLLLISLLANCVLFFKLKSSH